MRQKDQIMTIKIRVKGAVQGVGFRPFIAETATKYGIKGNVKNIGAAVDILAIGNKVSIRQVLLCLICLQRRS